MNRRLLVWITGGLLFLGAACSDTISDGDEDPIEFEEEDRRGDEGGDGPDYCAEFGWYGDGTCDDFCVQTDPDCDPNAPNPSNNAPEPDPEPGPEPTEPEPDPEPDPEPEPEPVDPECEELESDPEVEWQSRDPGECALMGEWLCADGKELFSNQCGCGCRPEDETQPVECLDDSDPMVSRVGEPDECARIDYVCEEGWDYFQDDCGCGCVRQPCADDGDCPDGYCGEIACGTDAPCPLACHPYPNCDDDSEIVCDALPPTCPDGEVAAIRDGCWKCVDERTCEPSTIDG